MFKKYDIYGQKISLEFKSNSMCPLTPILKNLDTNTFLI